ncbi:hypothetical protein JYU34_008419 [Plutella xylostella]|uniref:RHD domain-containing protein n=1 Tax=Plutella xylostella TaxID=51655 RepID=A0ABQ7QKW0_PLUXY|nr:hypothetical protein JYU34_008419 [Plutella xylostella]
MYRPAAAAAAPPPDRPYVRILEQPASKALRFRYECEGRSAGSIPGASSTPEKKTFPAIEICGHKGRAIVVVSCVTKDAPHRPHPHNLVGRELCKKGVCTMNAPADSAVVTFTNLGIQCVKRRDIEDALAVREEMRVDPFKTGFSHKNSPQSIDLNAVRLCFQVFLPDERSGKIRHALPPVVSDVIYDKKAMSDLVITRLSHCSAPAQGGKQVILLCEKVAREDITVTFFEKSGERVTWQADAADVFVHKQVAICFTTPPYRDPHVQDHVQAYIQLRRPTDNATSEPLPFELLPSSADPNYLKRKRQKPIQNFSRYLQPIDSDMKQQLPDYFQDNMALSSIPSVKLEPRDKTPPHNMSSPPLLFPPAHAAPAHHDPYAWNMQLDNMQSGLTAPGPSRLPQYNQDMAWTNQMGHVSPMHQAMSPNMGHVSPMHQAMSPNMGHVSPMHQAMSPNMVQSPMGHVSPNMGHVSPNMGHVSPNLGHVSPNLCQQPMAPMAQQLMDPSPSDPPSITGLLMDRPDQPYSGELSGLSALLAEAAPAEMLSDSLNRLSTGDLLRQVDM